MCGIIGFNFKSNNENIFSVTSHRGPDNTSKVEIGKFTLGHNRLSIVDHNDLSNQPMMSECGRYTIVFNGEVYNHADIREKLKSKYNFKTASDTEAMLYSYIEYGKIFWYSSRKKKMDKRIYLESFVATFSETIYILYL